LTGVKRFVVVVTDSLSSFGIEVAKEYTDRLKTKNIKFFSVGTSALVNKPELDELAGNRVTPMN